METKQSYLSIKIIYWVTQITFWIFVAGGAIMTFIGLGMLFNLINHDLHLHIGLPVAFDLAETGKLRLLSHSVDIRFMDAYGKITFSELPSLIGRVYGLFILGLVGITFFMFYTFRKFIMNVYHGIVFSRENFRLLRIIAYALLVFWVFIVIYSIAQNFIIAQHLHFDSLIYAGSMQFHMEVVVVALLLLMLSHIFMHGTELKEERELTI